MKLEDQSLCGAALAAGALGRGCRAGRAAQAKEQFFPLLVVPHRRLRAQRHALGQRLQSTTSSWSTRATAASTA